MSILVMIWGAVRFRQLLATAEQQYKINHLQCSILEPEKHLRVTTRPERTLRLLTPVPAVLVTLGILGTFVGLGIAITEAIPAFRAGASDGVIRGALTSLLTAIQFKFQTSAYGIFASLMMLALITSFEHWMSWTIELRADDLQAHHRPLSSELGTVLHISVATAFASIGTELSSSLKQVAEAVTTFGTESSMMTEGVNVLRASVDSFAGRVVETTGALSTSAKRLGTLGTQVDESLGRVATTLKTAADDQQRELLKALKGLDASMSARLERLGEDQMKILGNISQEIHGAITEFKNSIESTSAAQNIALNELSGSAGTTASATKEAINRLGEAVVRMEGANADALQTQERGLGRIAEEQRKSAENLKTAVDGSLNELKSAIDSLSRHQQTALEQLQKHQSEATSALKDLAGTLNEYKNDNKRLLDLVDRLHGEAANRERPTLPRQRPKDAGPTTPETSEDGSFL